MAAYQREREEERAAAVATELHVAEEPAPEPEPQPEPQSATDYDHHMLGGGIGYDMYTHAGDDLATSATATAMTSPAPAPCNYNYSTATAPAGSSFLPATQTRQTEPQQTIYDGYDGDAGTLPPATPTQREQLQQEQHYYNQQVQYACMHALLALCVCSAKIRGTDRLINTYVYIRCDSPGCIICRHYSR